MVDSTNKSVSSSGLESSCSGTATRAAVLTPTSGARELRMPERWQLRQGSAWPLQASLLRRRLRARHQQHHFYTPWPVPGADCRQLSDRAVSNPIQLLPSSYHLTATAIIKGKHKGAYRSDLLST